MSKRNSKHKGNSMLSKIGFVTVALLVGLAFGLVGGYIKLNGDVQVNHAKLQSDAKTAYHKTGSVLHNLSK